MSYLPFAVETLLILTIIFLMVTQVIIPLFLGIPTFWIFSKKGRQITDSKLSNFLRKK